jgi:hypothetical protein
MLPHEAKRVFLQMLNISTRNEEELKVTLPSDISFEVVWQTFKEFIAVPLERVEQIFGFECIFKESELYISLKRNMYPSFDDDPDAVYPLSFEATALYVTTKPAFYEYVFFTEEV